MTRSTIARVDLAALRHNFAAIQQYLAAESGRTPPSIIAVVKANGYGHGAARIALALEQAGADVLACADLTRGGVTSAGVRAPPRVQRISPDLPMPCSSIAHADDRDATSRTGCTRQRQTATSHRISLKIDTGMHRLGLRHDELHRALPAILASDHLRLEGVFTHFASADAPDSPVFNSNASGSMRQFVRTGQL